MTSGGLNGAAASTDGSTAPASATKIAAPIAAGTMPASPERE